MDQGLYQNLRPGCIVLNVRCRRFLLSLLWVTGLCAGGARLAAQPKSYESQVSYQKGMQNATLIDLPYPADVVESSIKDYMAQRGWKGSNIRGYRMFHNVRLEDTASSLNDLHIRVERKSSRDKNSSVVTVLATLPGEDPGARSERNELVMNRTSAFVEKMVPAIEAGNLEDQIKTQEGTAKKAQHKLGNLHDDQGDLEKKIRSTQGDLAKNKDDQTKETQTMQANVQGDENAMKKSQKRMSKLLDDQTSLQKKLVKYQTSLEQNKKDQETQRVSTGQEQQSLDSLRMQRKH